MSDAVFPVLAGLGVSFKRLPAFKTVVKETTSGREFRSRLMASPRYTYKLTYEFLRDRRQGQNELRTLLGFFLARSGSFDDFLFDDTDDNSVTAQPLGTGDGVISAFQLVRTLGGFSEPIYSPRGQPTLYANGVPVTSGSWALGANGMVGFVSPPTAGTLLTWTGSYYWRCRFLQDQHEYERFAWRLWTLKTCDFITTKP